MQSQKRILSSPATAHVISISQRHIVQMKKKTKNAKAWKETSTHWVLGSVRLGLASAKMEWNERGAEDGKQKRLALFSPFLTPDFGSYASDEQLSPCELPCTGCTGAPLDLSRAPSRVAVPRNAPASNTTLFFLPAPITLLWLCQLCDP
jgi:hypothetical protein